MYDDQGAEYFENHIACGHTGQFKDTCTNGTILPMTNERKRLILNMHNTLRSRLALGELPNYRPAARMSTILWDDELESFAKLNVMQCEMKHDKCRNSVRFSYTGQNLGAELRNFPLDFEKAIEKHVLIWWNEYKDTTQNEIEYFIPREDKSLPMVFHFTQMANERATRIGCATSTFYYFYAGKWWHTILLCCNYNYTNINKAATYTFGLPCSQCRSGCSQRYPGLCDIFEEYPTVPDY